MAIVSKHNERHRYKIVSKVPGCTNLVRAYRIDSEGEYIGEREYLITSFRATTKEDQAILDRFGGDGKG